MRNIHKKPPKKRFELGEPFEKLLAAALKSTNTENLSHDWNQTDMARFLIAKGWESFGKTLPPDCKILLKPFYKDLDL